MPILEGHGQQGATMAVQGAHHLHQGADPKEDQTPPRRPRDGIQSRGAKEQTKKELCCTVAVSRPAASSSGDEED
jgi:hypothetical protein